MQDFEKLGLFYLGRRYDPETATVAEPILYDSRDLVTHAVCVGMTGSGKTGLCLALLEEAAIDGIPVIAIDPKGDLGNLLLTFPGLSADEFRPWVDEDEARRAGLSVEEFAAAQARTWREGLAESQQDGERIARLRAAAEFSLYTPGSGVGRPVSVLSSFSAPPAAERMDAELVAERAANAATSLLSLAGGDFGPRSREHTLLATILANAWTAGQDLTLPTIIQQVQAPAFERVGVLDLESFYPAKERFELALALNGVLAAPGFERWLAGDPLQIGPLLRTDAGKPRVSIFSIAHLGDAERMFFVSLLLNEILAWTRRQTGTSGLRAIVYMDEIAGYFPPVANPPSKPPLLTLLKQARAFGVGVVLATQNPVDLDYKGLSNTGTWFLGRLQTERDKARVLDGLDAAAAGSLPRGEADRILSSLGKRMFLLHNVHQPRPVVFQTRWVMSYLRGPLSREQVRRLAGEPHKTLATPGESTNATRSSRANGPTDVAGARPVLPPGIDEYFLPGSAAARSGAPTYTPVLMGAARVGFSDARLGIHVTRDVMYAAPIVDGPVAVDWQHAVRLESSPADLASEPASPDAGFVPPPAAALQPRNYAGWQKAFSQWLSRAERVELLRHPPTKLTSSPDETERDFRSRVQDALRAQRDEEVERIRRKFAARREALAERIRKADAAVGRETQQAQHQKTQTMLSAGAAVIGALLGRKTLSAGTLGRATTAARGVGRSRKEAEDVKRAQETADVLRQQLAALDDEILRATHAAAERYEAEPALDRVVVAPKRGQVTVHFVALGWDPS